MLDRCTTDEFARLTKYERIALYLFRRLTSALTASTFPNELHFLSADVVAAMNAAHRDGAINAAQANPPDIKYSFDARRDFPAEIEQLGPMTWLAVGKGRYKLKRPKRRNLFPFPNVELPTQ